MSEENIFAKMFVVGLISIIATFSSCTAYISHDDNLAMGKMVKDGADPIDAKCAIKASESSICAIRAATKNKK